MPIEVSYFGKNRFDCIIGVVKRVKSQVRFAHIFFMDGVGLGGDDPEINPFVSADMPALTRLFGPGWYLADAGPLVTAKASLVQTDATLGVAGRPQSATGQATILSGRNIAAAVGEHYGPKPNGPVRNEINKGTLFHAMRESGDPAALLSPYPDGYFRSIERGKSLYSAVPQAVVDAGYPLFGPEEMRRGDAVSPNFTGEAWHTQLGYTDMPIYTLAEAGAKLATLASRYTFSFFEHWPSDRLGHRGPLADAVRHLEMLDTVIGSLIDHWPAADGLLLITSDHGNIEEKNHRFHTLNPVPTILCGPQHAELAAQLANLADIAPTVLKALSYP